RRAHRLPFLRRPLDLSPPPGDRQPHRSRSGGRPRDRSRQPCAAPRAEPSDARRLLARRAQGRGCGRVHHAPLARAGAHPHRRQSEDPPRLDRYAGGRGLRAGDGRRGRRARRPLQQCSAGLARIPDERQARHLRQLRHRGGRRGLPRLHFHRDVLAACDCFPPYVLKAEPDDIFCGSPPLAFTFGLGGLLLFPLRIGASTLLLQQASPPQLLQGIQDHRATIVFTAPTAYRAMTDLVKGFDISSLKKCVSAGETLPKATFERWREATGLKIIDGIGSTEMLHIFVSSSGDDIRPGATGRVVPGYEARVIDDEGNDVPPGTIGHLAVRGPTGCRYLDNLERQRIYVRNGWNLPGDSYLMDADGYFWYQARTDDLIVSAGHKISGPEIEAVLLDHPAVAECGVVAAPDESRGFIVKAYIVVRAGFTPGQELVKELQDFVKAEIAPYKYPRAIEFLESLPRTDTGKLQRFRLREMNP